jgi:hypothetical protein
MSPVQRVLAFVRNGELLPVPTFLDVLASDDAALDADPMPERRVRDELLRFTDEGHQEVE